jgi:hypothetical protein
MNEEPCIELHELHPSVAARLRWRVPRREVWRQPETRALQAWLLLLGVLVLGIASTTSGGPTAAWPWAAVGSVGVVGFGCYMWWRVMSEADSSQPLDAAELRRCAGLRGLPAGERSYLEAVASLAESRRLLGEALTADLLEQAGSLLVSWRTAEAQRQQLLTLQRVPLEKVRAEKAELEGRLPASPDGATRQLLEQSLRLCEERLVHAEEVGGYLARIEAQQALAYQALASIQTTAARLGGLPGDARAASDAEQLRSIVSQLRAQTRAVEDAAREVRMLGGA